MQSKQRMSWCNTTRIELAPLSEDDDEDDVINLMQVCEMCFYLTLIVLKWLLSRY